MNTSTLLQNQLLTTKFYVPVRSGPVISRPRLTGLLDESLKYPLTLVSAAAGFGKTTLLANWSQSLPPSTPRVAWVSLEEEDNDPRLFWSYVLTALHRQEPQQRFAPLLMQLQSPQSPPLNYLLAELINLLVEATDHFVLILDDYQVITEQQVHTTLAFLIEHLPPQLRIMVATRADPPLPLPLLRAGKQALEVRTDQLRCTPEETRAFFDQVMGIQLPDETIQQVTARTEGWLVGLQLLGLSFPGHADPFSLLEEVRGDQRYILGFLTEEVLQQQPQEVQTFLLCTCILERLTASLCDAVMQQHGSQQLLQRLEQTNLFVVSLDSKRQWYRYHALFTEALRYQLEQTHADLVPLLHHRASLWYAEHNQTTQAILHAFDAHQWQWAADLIEREHLPLLLFAWGGKEHELSKLQAWLERLPTDVKYSRPQLYLACAQMLWQVIPSSTLKHWLDMAEATLTTSLTIQMHEDVSSLMLSPRTRQEQENLLGEVIAWRAYAQSFEEDGEAAFPLCQRALTLLSAENSIGRIHVAWAQFMAYYYSSANDTMAAIQSAVQASLLAQAAGPTVYIIGMASIALTMLTTGQLHEAQRYIEQARLLGTQSGGNMLPQVGWSLIPQFEILREWNQLDAALSLAEEAISLCKKIESIVSLVYTLQGSAHLLRIYLSRGELDAARSTLQEFERVSMGMNQALSLQQRSTSITVDQVRLWLACGERDHAMRWAEELDLKQRCGPPLVREREDVARARVLLATNQPALALQGLKSVLERATAGQRWGHVIEIRILQAQAHEMHHEETLALDALSEAVRLAEPEGYIRSFVDEGAPMARLLSRLREHQHKDRPTPYLDTLLAAFPSQNQVHKDQPKQTRGHTMAQPLVDPLSEREREILQLLARGVSNQEIAQELVIAIDTVKRHVSHIFAKLGVNNRVQAVRQAHALDLLDEDL